MCVAVTQPVLELVLVQECDYLYWIRGAAEYPTAWYYNELVGGDIFGF